MHMQEQSGGNVCLLLIQCDDVLVLEHVVQTNLLATRVLGRRAVDHGVLELPLDVLVDSVTEVFDLAAATAQDYRLRVVGLLSFRLGVDTNEAGESALRTHIRMPLGHLNTYSSFFHISSLSSSSTLSQSFDEIGTLFGILYSKSSSSCFVSNAGTRWHSRLK